jgi:hypothetical protein
MVYCWTSCGVAVLRPTREAVLRLIVITKYNPLTGQRAG